MTAPWAHVWMEVEHKPKPSEWLFEAAAAFALIVAALALRAAPHRVRNGSTSSETAASPVSPTPLTPLASPMSGFRQSIFRQALGSVLTGCAVGLFVGGLDGVLTGTVSSVGVLVFGSRRASAIEKRRRLQLIAAAPPVVDLFAAGLSAGLLPADAAAIAADAFTAPSDGAAPEVRDPEHQLDTRFTKAQRGAALLRRRLTHHDSGLPHPAEPTREIAARFAAAAQSLRLGVDPEVAWRALAVDDATAPVAAAALRASRTGAPAAETVAKAARDLWSAAEHVAQTQVRSVAVRVTVPLALCFLPAFVLVGIVPTALGILAELRP